MKRAGVIFFAVGVLVTLNAVAASFASNMHSGILFTYALGILFAAAGTFHEVMPKAVKCAFYGAVIVAAAFIAFVFVYGHADSATFREDAVIVLGAGVRGDEIPDNLRNRLDAAASYHAKNPDAVIVVSGGQGPGEDIAEADAMQRYLVSAGVPEGIIIKEDRAASTDENFEYSKALLDALFDRQYSAAFVTSDYHVFRAEYLANDAGLAGITHVHGETPWSLVLPNGIRECLGIVRQCVLRWK